MLVLLLVRIIERVGGIDDVPRLCSADEVSDWHDVSARRRTL